VISPFLNHFSLKYEKKTIFAAETIFSGVIDCMDINKNTKSGGCVPRYKLKIDNNEYAFDDPIVTGQQLLLKAGKTPAPEHLLFQLLKDGQLEEIRLEETVDLREPGREKFITFLSDRSFRFLVDDRQFEWGLPFITGRKIKKLAGVDPAKFDLWQEIRGAEDIKIGDTDRVDLSEKGVERFFTAQKSTTEGLCKPEELLPSGDHEYLKSKGYNFEAHREKNQTGIIFREFLLPEDHYDAAKADVLILLPANYPDASPDMFFTNPWVKLKSTGGYPKRADVSHIFSGVNWQRWSRHNNQWRPGVDGIWTMIKRVENALEVAK
jgi:hypothetical protein